MIIVGNFHAINSRPDKIENQCLIDMCQFYVQNDAVMKEDEIKIF